MNNTQNIADLITEDYLKRQTDKKFKVYIESNNLKDLLKYKFLYEHAMKDSMVYMASYDLLDSLGTVFQLSVRFKEGFDKVEERDIVRLINRFQTDYKNSNIIIDNIYKHMLYIRAYNHFYKKNDYSIQYEHLNNLGISLIRFFNMALNECLSFLEMADKYEDIIEMKHYSDFYKGENENE